MFAEVRLTYIRDRVISVPLTSIKTPPSCENFPISNWKTYDFRTMVVIRRHVIGVYELHEVFLKGGIVKVGREAMRRPLGDPRPQSGLPAVPRPRTLITARGNRRRGVGRHGRFSSLHPRRHVVAASGQVL